VSRKVGKKNRPTPKRGATEWGEWGYSNWTAVNGRPLTTESAFLIRASWRRDRVRTSDQSSRVCVLSQRRADWSLAECYLTIVLGEKSEINFCEAVADILHCASLEPKSLGHHPQIIMEFNVALFDVVSNFAAFKGCYRWVGNPPPSYRLPVLQLMYFTA
jgi:hypothetical protein